MGRSGHISPTVPVLRCLLSPKGQEPSQEATSPKANSYPQKTADVLPNPRSLYCAAPVGTCPESVYSILNLPGTLPESSSLWIGLGLLQGLSFAWFHLKLAAL